MVYVQDRASLSLDELKAHERWLTVFVGQLVSPSDVEDVLQDTWLAAIERPPQQHQAWRKWLGTVARNLAIARWKTRRRQRRSEQRAARIEALPSTEETVERLATLEALVGVIRELPEPYRETVLLRHYHGLSVRETAEHLGVSSAAVRQRAKRGLAEVRGRLREQRGRDRRLLGAHGWGAGAVALAKLCGVILMNVKWVLGLVAVALVAGSVGLLGTTSTSAGAVSVESGVDVPEARSESGPTATEMRRTVPGSKFSPESAPGTRRYLVLSPTGTPVPGVMLSDRDGAAVGSTDADGQFRTEPALGILRPGSSHEVLRQRVRGAAGRLLDELLYVVAPRVAVRGQVVQSGGAPIEGVRILVEALPLVDFPRPLEGTRARHFPGGTTDAAGRFAIDGLPGGACRLRFRKVAFADAEHEVAVRTVAGVDVQLQELPGGRWWISGRVLDPSGWLVPEATVRLGKVEGRADSYGRYRLELGEQELQAEGARLVAARPGFEPLVASVPKREDFREDRTLDRDLQLPGLALSIRGTVLGPEGDPAVGAVVALWKVRRVPGVGFVENLTVAEDRLPHKLGIAPRRVYAVVGEDGAFELSGLRNRNYSLRVLHHDYLTMTSAPVAAGAAGVALRYPEDQFREVRVRVVGTNGKPMVGLDINSSTQSHESGGSAIWDVADTMKTDAKGETLFRRVLRHETTHVRVRGENIITAFAQLEPTGPEFEEMVVARRCHFRIESSDPKHAASSVTLKDGEGKRVWISWSRGTYNEAVQLADGRSPVITASELAKTLVVDEKKRVDIKLIPGEVVVVRF